MKNTFKWSLIALPLIVGIVLLSFFCISSYHDGYEFAQGLHGFKWILLMHQGSIIFVPALLASLFTVIMNRKQLKKNRLFWRAVALVICSVLIPLISLPLMKSSFFKGREKAYKQLDFPKIYSACVELRGQLTQGETFLMISHGEEQYESLPNSIRVLKPLYIYVTPHAIAIQIDGGGIMYHEGIGVVLTDKKRSPSLPSENLRRLHKSLPIYLYRLYDSRVFIDKTMEME